MAKEKNVRIEHGSGMLKWGRVLKIKRLLICCVCVCKMCNKIL
jgi:hypothetical protein